jgi:hypothetical protein
MSWSRAGRRFRSGHGAGILECCGATAGISGEMAGKKWWPSSREGGGEGGNCEERGEGGGGGAEGAGLTALPGGRGLLDILPSRLHSALFQLCVT